MPGPDAHALVLVGADGTERVLGEEPLAFENPQFSPDGGRLAVAASRRLGEPTDIWIHDLTTWAVSRLTFDGGRDGGRCLGLFDHVAAQRRRRTPAADRPGIGVGRPPLVRRAVARLYMLEAGRFEVYVAPFPEGRPRWLISDEGGRDPTWGADGTEIFYRSGDRLVAARIDTTTGVRALARRVVLQPFSPPLYDDYDVHPVDGRIMALVRPRDDYGRDVVIVLDWLADLRRATGRQSPGT